MRRKVEMRTERVSKEIRIIQAWPSLIRQYLYGQSLPETLALGMTLSGSRERDPPISENGWLPEAR